MLVGRGGNSRSLNPSPMPLPDFSTLREPHALRACGFFFGFKNLRFSEAALNETGIETGIDSMGQGGVLADDRQPTRRNSCSLTGLRKQVKLF